MIDEEQPELQSAIQWTKKYPPLSASQLERRHVPEMMCKNDLFPGGKGTAMLSSSCEARQTNC